MASQNEFRVWNGLQVDAELKDSWLDRLNQIPGLVVHQTCAGHEESHPDSLRAYPNIQFTIRWPGGFIKDSPQDRKALIDNFQIAFNGVGKGRIVEDPDGENYFTFSSLKTRGEMSKDELTSWWETFTERMESLAVKYPHHRASSKEIAQDILGGMAKILEWWNKTPAKERQPWNIHYPIAGKNSWEEASRFANEMEKRNGMNLVDMYFHSIGDVGWTDIVYHRNWFGITVMEAALDVLGNHAVVEYLDALEVPRLTGE